jgi:transposase InsO family protein
MTNTLASSHPVNLVGLSLGISRSSLQYQLNQVKQIRQVKELEDILIRDEIEKPINKPASSKYGYRPMTKQYLEFYHHKRIHESLNDQTPAAVVGYNINYEKSPICV